MARGLKNNNPLNIRHNKDVFQGEVIPSQDKAFKQFSSMAYGYRAAFVTLGTYLLRDRRNTISKIISAWAPPEDNNDTEAYITAVSRYAGISPNYVLTEKDGVLYQLIVSEMSRVENGQRAQFKDVEAGFKLQSKITTK